MNRPGQRKNPQRIRQRRVTRALRLGCGRRLIKEPENKVRCKEHLPGWNMYDTLNLRAITFSGAGIDMTLGDTAVTIGGRYLSKCVIFKTIKKLLLNNTSALLPDTFGRLAPGHLRVQLVIVKINTQVSRTKAWGRLAANGGRDLHRSHAVDDPVCAAASVASDTHCRSKIQEIQEFTFNSNRGTTFRRQMSSVRYCNVNLDERAGGLHYGRNQKCMNDQNC